MVMCEIHPEEELVEDYSDGTNKPDMVCEKCMKEWGFRLK